METGGTWRSCRLPKGKALRDGPACLVREPRTDGPAPLLERWRRACVRRGAPDRLRRAPSDGAALPGRRALQSVASADGEAVRVSLEDVEIPADDRRGDLVALDEALERLAVEDPRKARVVELRFFGGLSMQETAQAVGISVRTAQNDWTFARAWLYRALIDGPRA